MDHPANFSVAIAASSGNQTSELMSDHASSRDMDIPDSTKEASRTIISISFTPPEWPWHTMANGDRPRPKSKPVGAGWYERKTTSLTIFVVMMGAFI